MVQCRRSGICCLSIESRVAVDRHKNGMLIMCTLTCARASTGRRQARVPTIESRSVNGRGGQAEEQVLWWRQIWLLSTSAFLNTRSYLPSPLEKRSFLFFFLLLPLPSLSFLPSLPSRLIYLVPTSPFILHSLIFQFFFFQESLVCYFHFHSTPHYPLLPLFTLNGTAHSATKQSCLEHHTLANQAGPEFSSRQTRSAKSGYGEALEWRGGRGESLRRTNSQRAMMPIKDNAGDNH